VTPGPPSAFRSGYVAIVGWPNVGKSSLLNCFLGAKLSIVSPKPQTTRESVLGIWNEPGVQMIFLDTPGWLKPADAYQVNMKRAIMRSLHDDADVVLWLIEAGPFTDEHRHFGQTLGRTEKPLVVAVNKADALPGKEIFGILEAGLKEFIGREFSFVPVSAKTGQGVSVLKSMLKSLLPAGHPFYPIDQMTDRWERFYVAELIRENLFKLYRDEVPHACAVVIDAFEENSGRKDRIKALINVESEGQQRILIGDKGRAIKELGQSARMAIEQMLGRPVYLELAVKVRKNWRRDANFVKQLAES
jgi:GTP-binding protein Era